MTYDNKGFNEGTTTLLCKTQIANKSCWLIITQYTNQNPIRISQHWKFLYVTSQIWGLYGCIHCDCIYI